MLSLKEFHDIIVKSIELSVVKTTVPQNVYWIKISIELGIHKDVVKELVREAYDVIRSEGDYNNFLANSIVRLLKEDAKLDVKKDYNFYKMLELMMKEHAAKYCIKDIDAAMLMSNACMCVKPSKQINEWCDIFNYRYHKGYVFDIAGTNYITDKGFQLVKNVVNSINEEN